VKQHGSVVLAVLRTEARAAAAGARGFPISI